LELVVAGTEPAGVGALVDVAARLGAPHHLDGRLDMIGIGGPDEAVVADLELVEGAAPLGGPLVDEGLRVRRMLSGEGLDLRGVLIHTGQESGLIPEQALVAGQRIGTNRLEQRMQRRRRGRVEDRGGEVVAHASSSSSDSSSSASTTVAPAPTATPCVRPLGQYSSLRICSGSKPRAWADSSTATIMSGLPHRYRVAVSGVRPCSSSWLSTIVSTRPVRPRQPGFSCGRESVPTSRIGNPSSC